jgi:hypothetical protein
MELSTTAVAHIALDLMITASVLLDEIVKNGNEVDSLGTLQTAIMSLMNQCEIARVEESKESSNRIIAPSLGEIVDANRN